MNPLTIDPLRALGGVVIMLAVGFGGGWLVNGWRLSTALAQHQADTAKAQAKSAGDALAQLESRIKAMNESSTEARSDVSSVNAKLNQISKELKNVQANRPLPAGCRPDDVRVQSIRKAVDTANAAIQGAAAR